ncbi:MAG: hypothetical protein AAGE59_28700 [Cyanobacteria bacterium P01_F01_bin.86]
MANYGHIVNSFPLRMSIGCYPRLFYPLYRLVPVNRRLAVNPKTQLVIEGFPRSANTFAVLAFEKAQANKVSLSHHMHVPAQIIRASRWQIPTLVLVRKPEDSIASYIMRKPKLSIADALKCYIRFYKVALPYQENYVTANFEDITSNFSEVINRVNRKFNTDFTAATPTGEALEQIFAETSHMAKQNGMGEMGIARPSEERKALKKELIAKIKSSEYQSLLKTADDVYAKVYQTSLGKETIA